MPQIPGTVARPYKFAGKRSIHSNVPPCGPHLPDMVGASYQNQLSQYRIVSLENYYHYPHIHSYTNFNYIYIRNYN